MALQQGHPIRHSALTMPAQEGRSLSSSHSFNYKTDEVHETWTNLKDPLDWSQFQK